MTATGNEFWNGRETASGHRRSGILQAIHVHATFFTPAPIALLWQFLGRMTGSLLVRLSILVWRGAVDVQSPLLAGK